MMGAQQGDTGVDIAELVDRAVDGISGVTTRPRGRALERLGAGLTGREPGSHSDVRLRDGRWVVAVDVAVVGVSAPVAAERVATVLAELEQLRSDSGEAPEITVRIVDVSSARFLAN